MNHTVTQFKTHMTEPLFTPWLGNSSVPLINYPPFTEKESENPSINCFFGDVMCCFLFYMIYVCLVKCIDGSIKLAMSAVFDDRRVFPCHLLHVKFWPWNTLRYYVEGHHCSDPEFLQWVECCCGPLTQAVEYHGISIWFCHETLVDCRESRNAYNTLGFKSNKVCWIQ